MVWQYTMHGNGFEGDDAKAASDLAEDDVNS
jgi:hypothetical protein